MKHPGQFESGTNHRRWVAEAPLGKTFGDWTVVSSEILRHGGLSWRVRCACGTEGWRQASCIRTGRSTCCATCSQNKGPHFAVLGRRYDAILSRCTRPTNPSWARYGGRGIECRFPSREAFVYWVVENLPHENYAGVTIDRIDGNGHYEPGNLRLATQRQQMANMCRNFRVDYCGTPVLVTHIWHLLKTDFPRMALGPGRTQARLRAGQPWQELVEKEVPRVGGRQAKTPPKVDPAIVRIYRPQ